ncbi:nuclear transport factor 2 family protein [Acidobacteria bacterium AB60]|nr:nuclear transport factor 2 family protein [Acidobacteria bacterium AB60]
MTDPRDLLRAMYRQFNAREIDSVLARMRPDVVWPNGMEGGYVYGVEAVRAYWTRQWAMIDPKVDPVSIAQDQNGRWVVEVHQVVHDLAGNLLLDTTVHHAYQIENEQIVRMDIE